MPTKPPRQFNLVKVERHAEIDGIDMGVLSDGTPFLSTRGLAAICGLAPSTLIEWAQRWSPAASSGIDRAIKDLLEAQGYFEDALFVPLVENGRQVHAYPDVVCMAILEYYAFDAREKRAPAERNYRVLARAGLRTFIYAKTGYDPTKLVPDPWRDFHARMLLNGCPPGFFSILKETAELVVTAIRGGLHVDSHTVPDGSVGIMWAKHWAEIAGTLFSPPDSSIRTSIRPTSHRARRPKLKHGYTRTPRSLSSVDGSTRATSPVVFRSTLHRR